MNDSRKDRGEEIKISVSPSNKSLNGAGSLSCRPVTCTVYKIINTANWSLKQKIYILKYICLYILRFILLFTSSLPFYNFLQAIGVVTGVGWVRNLRPKRGKGTSAKGLTSDTSLGSLAFDGNAFSVRSRLCFDSKLLSNTIVYNTVSYWFFSAVARGGAGGPGTPQYFWQARLIWSAETLFTLLFCSKCSFQFDKDWNLFIYLWLQQRKMKRVLNKVHFLNGNEINAKRRPSNLHIKWWRSFVAPQCFWPGYSSWLS